MKKEKMQRILMAGLAVVMIIAMILPMVATILDV